MERGDAMMNVMEIEMFRGEFMGLNGSADFYVSDIEGLKREDAILLRVVLPDCRGPVSVRTGNTFANSDSFEARVRGIMHRSECNEC